MAKVGEHRVRLLLHVPPGVTPELIAASPRLPLSLAILLPDMPGAVVAVAVELDRQPMLRPAAVNAPSIDASVRLGLGKRCRSEPLKESALESAESNWSFSPHHPPELARAGPVVAPAQYLLHPVWRRVVTDVCLMDGAGQIVLIEDRGEVDERPLDGGDWDASPHGCVSHGAAPHAVSDHAEDPTISRAMNFGK
ncbi:MAG TPA: hypothetical protein VI035_04200 [Solirubrobacterales bacterium]